jgi:23S rRNA (adenine2503-C2)-methyltransferase
MMTDPTAAISPAALEQQELTELTRPDLQAALERLQVKPYRAGQIARWVYKRGVTDFAGMSDLPKDLRVKLPQSFAISTPRIVRTDASTDGTRKFLLELSDGREIESVFIPDTPADARSGAGRRGPASDALGGVQPPSPSFGEPRRSSKSGGGGSPPSRMTFCVSTQVGCAMGCAFCLTGKMGLVRNLTAGEIVGQVRLMARELELLDKRFNIVLMGMGEPLHNYDQTMKALAILADPDGFAISPRRITLSTVGASDKIERLATEPLMPNLAISLHATTDELRDKLVPVNRKYRLNELLEVCRRFPLKRRNRITFEYVLLSGVNDTPEDARRLVRLVHGIRAKINLIPLNEAPGIEFKRPSDERINRFAQILADHHLTVSVRKSRGRDIRAACGQLIVEGEKKSPAQRAAALMDGSA